VLLLQKREEMRGICGRDDVYVSEEEAISYPAKGRTHQREADEEVATLGPCEREAPCFLEDLAIQLYREGGDVVVFVDNGHGEAGALKKRERELWMIYRGLLVPTYQPPPLQMVTLELDDAVDVAPGPSLASRR